MGDEEDPGIFIIGRRNVQFNSHPDNEDDNSNFFYSSLQLDMGDIIDSTINSSDGVKNE